MKEREGAPLGRHTPLTVSLLEPALLVLIQKKASHGYLLLTELEPLGMGTIHPSVVYRTLREMEGLTWIESDWDAGQTQGPPRRTYRLNGRGEEILDQWQNELIKGQEIIAQLLKGIG
jgi:DNA-binding PadR family transcriptional regulator